MEIIGYSIAQVVLEIVIFLTLVLIGTFFLEREKRSSNRYLNPQEFLPIDEIHTLRQIYYLILMAMCLVVFFYAIIFWDSDYWALSLFDAVLSLYIAITIDKKSLKNKILVLLLVPFGSLTFFMFNFSLGAYISLIHIPVYLYFTKYYFDKFMEYTSSNGLGITIILLFVIVFVSFVVTMFAENVNPLDSLVMVSNAFTSNGYAVLGQSIPGKINSLFLVWGGYIISGAGTATLTAAILIKRFNKRFRELERLLEEEDK
ncbi:hypothetical protein [Methanobrevibacter sp.]|uniref:hypothetical protein n=1 Tax=Methanobrevibacter sp. TaxID=66852 RepID=UPI00388D638B